MSGHRMVFQTPDAFERGQNLLAQAAQSYSRMGQNITRTDAYKPGALDYLDMGVGYGLAGMKAYDMYKGWKKGSAAATADPIGQVLRIFGGGNANVGSQALNAHAAGTPLLAGQAASSGAAGKLGLDVGTRGLSGYAAGSPGLAGVVADKAATPSLSAQVAAAPLKSALGLGAAGLGGFFMGRGDRQGGGKNIGGGVKSGIMGGLGGFFALGGPKGAALGAGVGLLGYLLG